LVKGNISAAVICFTLLGALIGFLCYNLPPAKIFMGDSGSLSMGFLLSVLPLLGQYDTAIEIGFIAAVVTLGIPILDTATAILRRARAGIGVFTPDMRHIHHKLLMIGLNNWASLLVLGLTGLVLGLSALSTLFLTPALSFLVKIGTFAVLILVFLVFHFLTAKKSIDSTLPSSE
jgi:UDP-GlcNAc:undecaprenyl-phosphate GlcNAc-1-phosphate transferase